MAGKFTDLSNNLLNSNGQANYTSKGGQGIRNTYPAVVINTEDPAEQNRIVCRIINIDESGEIKGGRDKDTPDEKLPLCFPLVPEFLHVRPIVGEMVLLILENPNDNSAPRYWVGPIVSSKLKLRNQTYAEAIKMFDHTDFFTNRKVKNKPAVSLAFPSQNDIAIQGREDADLILRPREVYLTAGKFKPNSFELNEPSPCFLQLKQTIHENKELSQANLSSVNINIYSPYGKFRKESESKFENNLDLDKFGDLAKILHPAVFGDELIKVLDLIIKVLYLHVHTPQQAAISIPELEQLKSYTISGRLQELISNHIRIN